MKHGEKQHKEAWIKYVANKLGFKDFLEALLLAETLYNAYYY